MDKQTMDEIWLQVKENQRKLDTCRMHDFSIDLNPERPMRKKYQCTRCEGSVDLIEKKWYEKGLQHQAAVQDHDSSLGLPLSYQELLKLHGQPVWVEHQNNLDDSSSFNSYKGWGLVDTAATPNDFSIQEPVIISGFGAYYPLEMVRKHPEIIRVYMQKPRGRD